MSSQHTKDSIPRTYEAIQAVSRAKRFGLALQIGYVYEGTEEANAFASAPDEDQINQLLQGLNMYDNGQLQPPGGQMPAQPQPQPQAQPMPVQGAVYPGQAQPMPGTAVVPQQSVVSPPQSPPGQPQMGGYVQPPMQGGYQPPPQQQMPQGQPPAPPMQAGAVVAQPAAQPAGYQQPQPAAAPAGQPIGHMPQPQPGVPPGYAPPGYAPPQQLPQGPPPQAAPPQMQQPAQQVAPPMQRQPGQAVQPPQRTPVTGHSAPIEIQIAELRKEVNDLHQTVMGLGRILNTVGLLSLEIGAQVLGTDKPALIAHIKQLSQTGELENLLAQGEQQGKG